MICIGGPLDGTPQDAPRHPDIKVMQFDEPFEVGPPDVNAPSTLTRRRCIYHVERWHANHATFSFYRYAGLALEDCVGLVLSTYSNWRLIEIDNQRLKHKLRAMVVARGI